MKKIVYTDEPMEVGERVDPESIGLPSTEAIGEYLRQTMHGEKLRKVRKNLEATDEELARILGTDVEHIRAWEAEDLKTMRGQTLRLARKSLSLTQKRLAEILGTHVRNIQAWEAEDRRITGPTATAVRLLEAVQGTEIGARFGV